MRRRRGDKFIVTNREREFVTRAELLETQLKLTEDFQQEVNDIKSDLTSINERLLPLGKWLENIEENTKKMADVLEKQSEKQDQIMEKVHEQGKKIRDLETNATLKKERVRVRGSIIISIISLLGAGSGIGYIFGSRIAEMLFGK